MKNEQRVIYKQIQEEYKNKKTFNPIDFDKIKKHCPACALELNLKARYYSR